MSETSTPAASGPWPVLDTLERRVLGVLVEKQKTSKTADTYPLSLNALTTGCNQKSNRDPVLELEEEQVEDAVLRCLKKNLVGRITSTRVTRWRHLLYEGWHVDRVELAILAELLLRGPQTEGELRTRVSRMDPIDDLETLRTTLAPLKSRGLVVYLTPEERRGTVLTHGFHDPQELQRLRQHFANQPHSSDILPAGIPSVPSVVERPSSTSNSPGQLEKLEQHLNKSNGEIHQLSIQVTELQKALADLRREFRELKKSLGA